ncbi:MAG TPA: hypothetical protein PKV86_04075, partial [Syntrophobacteraceae bacterium]|nr:hypothetical protein [Syntrophobacteraceae bacterium]
FKDAKGTREVIGCCQPACQQYQAKACCRAAKEKRQEISLMSKKKEQETAAIPLFPALERWSSLSSSSVNL